MDADTRVYVDKERFLSEYHREIRAWKNIITVGIQDNVPIMELVRDDERYHGKALGFLTAMQCLPLSIMPEAEIEILRKELCNARDWCDEQIKIYDEIG
jgi:hypothetical protein